MIIAERSQRREEVQLLRAFTEWKRIDYSKVLEGLKLYSATLDKQSMRYKPAKKTLFKWSNTDINIMLTIKLYQLLLK